MHKKKFIKVILIFSAAVFVLGIILTAAGMILGRGQSAGGFHYRYEYGIPNNDRRGGYDDDMTDDIREFFEEFGIPESGYDQYEHNTEI